MNVTWANEPEAKKNRTKATPTSPQLVTCTETTFCWFGSLVPLAQVSVHAEILDGLDTFGNPDTIRGPHSREHWHVSHFVISKPDTTAQAQDGRRKFKTGFLFAKWASREQCGILSLHHEFVQSPWRPSMGAPLG